MTFTTVAAPRAYVRTPQRGPVTRLLEDERWLAMLLLLPTVVLLGLFIAYPFVKGIELSVTDTKVGVPGHFVGLQNFSAHLERQHLSHRGVEHLPLHGCCHRVQTCSRVVVGGVAQQQLQRKGVYSSLYFTAVYYSNCAFYSCLEMDVRSDL